MSVTDLIGRRVPVRRRPGFRRRRLDDPPGYLQLADTNGLKENSNLVRHGIVPFPASDAPVATCLPQRHARRACATDLREPTGADQTRQPLSDGSIECQPYR